MKIASFILIIIIVLILRACSPVPANMSKDVYNAGITSLNTVDAYLKGNTDSNAALKELEKQFEIINNPYVTSNISAENLGVRLSIMNLIHLFYRIETVTIDNVLLERNALAEKLGETVIQ